MHRISFFINSLEIHLILQRNLGFSVENKLHVDFPIQKKQTMSFFVYHQYIVNP